MNNYQFAAPCLMGVEKLLSNELKFMGAQNVRADNGRVFFEGGAEMIARANIRSRIAERILIVCARFDARSFDELFEGVKAVCWSDYLPFDAAFPVVGSCLSSQLKSVSDCQGIIKKAIAESLKASYRVSGMMPESGSVYKIRFLILKDNACIMIDTSGEPLHKRGYRARANGAPIKETLAAAVCELAGVRSGHIVIDPCCGSGTILIEAALKALNIAPGLNRRFAAEEQSFLFESVWNEERNAARELTRSDVKFHAFGYDIDDQALAVAEENAKKAGVGEYLTFQKRDLCDFEEDFDKACVICNPPYGERLLDVNEAQRLFGIMGEKFSVRTGWSYNIICPDDDFERCFGRRADKRRKLYNGMISCQLYRYFKSINEQKSEIAQN